MKRLAAVAVGVAALGVAAWFLALRSAPTGPRVVEPGAPLPMDEQVALRFGTEDGGEEETWLLRKRELGRDALLEEFKGGSLPEPDPDAPDPDRTPDDSARALDGRARAAWREGDVAGALDLFAAAVETDPDDWVPRAHYGRLLTAVLDYRAALPQLERAAELAPDDPQRWLDLQTVYERTLALELAFEARRRAEDLAGGREIAKDWAGFWMVEGAESLP